jgi:hypothetical protein
MWLPDKIVGEVKEHVRVFYVDWVMCRYWNESRTKGEPLIFSGWYWSRGAREGGPFKSQSACYRDAWFRAVHDEAPPTLTGRNTREQDEAERARREAKTRHRRAQREARV